MAPPELHKGNKRLSCVAKPPDVQTKRGKVPILESPGLLLGSEQGSLGFHVVFVLFNSLEKLLGRTRNSMR